MAEVPQNWLLHPVETMIRGLVSCRCDTWKEDSAVSSPWWEFGEWLGGHGFVLASAK